MVKLLRYEAVFGVVRASRTRTDTRALKMAGPQLQAMSRLCSREESFVDLRHYYANHNVGFHDLLAETPP